ncbi:hypothetical protein GUITHDRAFT_150901 [Guillardia theta CCMP2712]|uniref:Uncharacterized protein n=1 Tax=Guillardia theta (strain CCMP2712) TaxID=905079 RepID=L1JTM3_GUITC|nr:hypothetical protein GUITHDRAFT_150901 [Guillardia theta CCMP2712]EKX51428.1 hypothetical protein GUITHDRAFT_150901 [Guillardia theta CCMP2712]|eukprot:XP_005838408.1 hypothetical protein GUITHDRAFT_150901 [Guillardia theta CCMP2712]
MQLLFRCVTSHRFVVRQAFLCVLSAGLQLLALIGRRLQLELLCIVVLYQFFIPTLVLYLPITLLYFLAALCVLVKFISTLTVIPSIII